MFKSIAAVVAPGKGTTRSAACAAILIASAPAPLLAQHTQTTTDSARILAPVVTTATRATSTIDQLPQRVTVITREEMDRTPAADAVDYLRKLATVDAIQYPGLLGYVSVRGFRPSLGTQGRTLILLDGRPAGAYNLALLDMSSIERIEILRGPASALYGSNAQGGVVNFISRRSLGAAGGSVSASYGSFATTDLMARAGGVVAHIGEHAVDADLSVRRQQQGNDFRIGRGGLFRDAIGGDAAYKVYGGTDRPRREIADTAGDGLVRDFTTFLATSGSARLGTELPARLRMDARGEFFVADDAFSPGDIYARNSGYPGNTRKNVSRRTGEVALRSAAHDSPMPRSMTHSVLARVYGGGEDTENYDQPSQAGFVSYVGETRNAGLQLQDVLGLGEQSLTVGMDVDRVDSRSRRYDRVGDEGDVVQVGGYSPDSRASSTAVFAQLRLVSANSRVTGVMGGRLDRVTLELMPTPFRPDVTPGSDHLTVFNPNVGVNVKLGAGLRLHGTAGRAFLNPDASGLAGYSEGTSGGVLSIVVGNPGLVPEHSVTIDGGMALSLPERGLHADLTYFTTNVEDRISTARATFAAGDRPTTSDGRELGSIMTAANAGSARIRGLEAQLSYDVGQALGRSYSLAFTASGTRILRAREHTPGVVVDTAGLASLPGLDPGVVFDRISLDPSRAITQRIKNVADLTATASVSYDDLRRISGRLGARYVGPRLDDDFADPTDYADVEYAPSLVVDLAVGVRLGGRYRVEGQVSNLTDENYYEKRGYNLAGRAFTLRLRADF